MDRIPGKLLYAIHTLAGVLNHLLFMTPAYAINNGAALDAQPDIPEPEVPPAMTLVTKYGAAAK